MIIVTGGAGFIGSNLVKALNDLGKTNILIVDHLGESNKYLNLNNLKFLDYLEKDTFLHRLPNFTHVETIFHQGACSDTTNTDGKYMMENNYEFSKKLLNYALDKKVDFIYASSASVYGNGDNGFTEERTSENPLNLYAFSKFLFDNYVRNITKEFTNDLGIQITGLRYFNVYGYQEGHKNKMASVMYHFYQQLKENKPVKLFEGSKKFLRDFVFVEDAVKVNMFFYENKTSGIFNCGTGKERSFYDIAKIYQDINPKVEIEWIPFPSHLKGKYQDFTKADLTNLRKAGYQDEFASLEEGVKKYYQYLNTL